MLQENEGIVERLAREDEHGVHLHPICHDAGSATARSTTARRSSRTITWTTFCCCSRCWRCGATWRRIRLKR